MASIMVVITFWGYILPSSKLSPFACAKVIMVVIIVVMSMEVLSIVRG